MQLGETKRLQVTLSHAVSSQRFLSAADVLGLDTGRQQPVLKLNSF